MAHPYKSGSKGSAKSKFKAILGHDAGGRAHRLNESMDKSMIRHDIGEHETEVAGDKSMKRLDKYARGGRTKHKDGKTVVNVIVPPSGGAAPPPPMPMMKPPMPPVPPMGGGPAGPMPPPMMRASGGSISGVPTKSELSKWANYASKNSYHKKLGGGIGIMSAGMDSGVGRLELSKHQGKKRGKG